MLLCMFNTASTGFRMVMLRCGSMLSHFMCLLALNFMHARRRLMNCRRRSIIRFSPFILALARLGLGFVLIFC